MTPRQRVAEPAFEFAKPPLDGGLVDPECARCRHRAAMPGDGQKIPKVAPLEHLAVMHFCEAVRQPCGCRAFPADSNLARSNQRYGRAKCTRPWTPARRSPA